MSELRSEWLEAADLIYAGQIQNLAIKSDNIFTALAIVGNPYTAPATLAELAGLWHNSNQVCEAIAADTRTPSATLQNMLGFKYGKRRHLAKETLAKQAEEWAQSGAAAVLAAKEHADDAAATARNAQQLAELSGKKKGKKYHADRASRYATEAAEAADNTKIDIADEGDIDFVWELVGVAKEKAQYAQSALRDCERAIW